MEFMNMSGSNAVLSERDVLRELQIKDFGQLTKNHVLAFAFMYDSMKPKAAKKALKQFPNFDIAVKQTLGELTEALDKALETNGKVVEEFYDSCSSMIKTLRRQIVNSTGSLEEREDTIRKLIEISKTIDRKNRSSGEYNGITVGELVAESVFDGLFGLFFN